MKILQIIKTNNGAGWAFRQISSLLKIANDIEIVVMLPNDVEGFAEKYKEIGVQVIPFDPSISKKNLLSFKRVKKEFIEIIEQIKPDLIHCHFVTNIIFVRLALRKINIPRIFQIPGPLHLESFLTRKIEILTADKNDYWVGSCHKTNEIYKKEGISSRRLFFATYSAPYDENYQVPKKNNQFRKKYQVADDDFLISMVCYFYKPKKYLLKFKGIKGHEDFINAISVVEKKYPNVKAMIIGGIAPGAEKYANKIIKYANKKCKNIIFTGHQENILDIYPNIDLAIHPSRSENYGGCVESLLNLVPTITSDAGGFPELIKEGKTGYLFKKGDYKELAEKIEYVICNYEKAKKTTIEGQKVALSFNPTASAKQIYIPYERIMKVTKGK